MAEEKRKIVIADDNLELCEILTIILESDGYDVSVVHDGFALIDYLKAVQDIEAIILDLMMPDRGGISIFDTIRNVSPASKIIIYTGYTNYKHSVLGVKADAFICKTDGAEKILESLKELLG